jgi:hypothetical protein
MDRLVAWTEATERALALLHLAFAVGCGVVGFALLNWMG